MTIRTEGRIKTTKKKTAVRSSSSAIADIAAKGAEDKKAADIQILDVRKEMSLCNYMVVCTALSTPQFNAIAEGVENSLEKSGIKTPAWQGKSESGWLVLDLINVVVHVLGKDERHKYKLEDLWGKTGVIYHV